MFKFVISANVCYLALPACRALDVRVLGPGPAGELKEREYRIYIIFYNWLQPGKGEKMILLSVMQSEFIIVLFLTILHFIGIQTKNVLTNDDILNVAFNKNRI